MNKLIRFFREYNEKFAIKATIWFGSMGMFWLFVIWSILPVFPVLTPWKDTILYVSAGVVQLAALPLLMVGQNLTGRAAEIRAEADHKMITEEFATMKSMMEELRAMHEDSHQLVQKVAILLDSDYDIHGHIDDIVSRLDRIENELESKENVVP